VTSPPGPSSAAPLEVEAPDADPRPAGRPYARAVAGDWVGAAIIAGALFVILLALNLWVFGVEAPVLSAAVVAVVVGGGFGILSGRNRRP